MAIVTKYSDYEIQSIEYLIEKIQEELVFRDMKGLTNNKVEIINVNKQHPLATLMAAQLQENRNSEALRASVLPAISVTPGNLTEEGFTLGQSYKTEVVDDDFIDELKELREKTNKEIQRDVLITKDQIEAIILAQRKYESDSVFAQIHQWRRAEEINVSAWSESPDMDILMGNVLDSIFSELQVGFAGDNSMFVNFRFKTTKGLTNFNFGRVLFGTEYNLTFTNTFNNYTIYQEDRISEHDFEGTFVSPGEE